MWYFFSDFRRAIRGGNRLGQTLKGLSLAYDGFLRGLSLANDLSKTFILTRPNLSGVKRNRKVRGKRKANKNNEE